MAKLIWFVLAVLWLCIAAVSKGVLIGTDYPIPETIEFFLNMISSLLVIILVLSQVSLLARVFILCLRTPVLVSLVIVTLLSKFLMQVEHRIVQLGEVLSPSTSRRRIL